MTPAPILLPITNGIVYARDLRNALRQTNTFTTWIDNNAKRHQLVPYIDFFRCDRANAPGMSKPCVDYILTLDAAAKIAAHNPAVHEYLINRIRIEKAISAAGAQIKKFMGEMVGKPVTEGNMDLIKENIAAVARDTFGPREVSVDQGDALDNLKVTVGGFQIKNDLVPHEDPTTGLPVEVHEKARELGKWLKRQPPAPNEFYGPVGTNLTETARRFVATCGGRQIGKTSAFMAAYGGQGDKEVTTAGEPLKLEQFERYVVRCGRVTPPLLWYNSEDETLTEIAFGVRFPKTDIFEGRAVGYRRDGTAVGAVAYDIMRKFEPGIDTLIESDELAHAAQYGPESGGGDIVITPNIEQEKEDEKPKNTCNNIVNTPQNDQSEAAPCDAVLIPHVIENHVILQRASDGYVNATAMCQANGKQFSGYHRLDSTQEFLQELKVSCDSAGHPLVISRGTGPYEERGSWVHPQVALHLAQWCSPKFAVWVTHWLYDWMKGQPAAPVLDMNDPAALRNALRQQLDAHDATVQQLTRIKESRNSILTEKRVLDVRLSQEEAVTGHLSRDIAFKQLELSEEQTKAQELAARRALEARCKPLSRWISETSTDHGHGPNRGLKELRALGKLHRALVKGCRNTKESAICQDWLNKGWLMYSSSDFLKTRKYDPNEDAEPILGADGLQVVGESRVVLITPTGTEPIMRFFMTRPEFLLRRLIATRRGTNIGRLSARYSFFEHDGNAWEELDYEERRDGVRICKPDAPGVSWCVWCDVEGRDKIVRRIEGVGISLELALFDLSDHYNDRV